MQAIGFLSRREYSRQELRTKLLDSLRKRAREDAALAAAAEVAARELAQALQEQPANGIDDAFAPRAPASLSAFASAQAPAGGHPTPVTSTHAALSCAATTRAALATLTRGDGGALPPSLRSRLDAVAAQAPAESRPGTAASPHAHLDEDADIGSAEPGFDAAPSPTSTARSSAARADAGPTLELTDPEAAVDQLLDWLVAEKYLNETRFVESRVNARSRKQGALRIRLELSRHGLTLDPEQAAALRDTEFERAKALWDRKFGVLAADAKERARQGRFLASRGFAAGVVRRIIGGEEES